MDADQGLPADLARETEMLRRIARGVLFEPALAEDAVQDAWLAALRAPRGTVTGGWLGETVKRVARGIRRRETRVAARERAAPRRDDSASAAETAERIELLRTLLAALHELDEPYRTAVRLRLLDDLSPREIAERLNVPLETVRTQVRRGIERLRAKLDVEHRARRDGRDAFLAALVPLVGADALQAGLATHAGLGVWGGVLVGTKLKWLAALAVIACIGLWWRNAATRPSARAEATNEATAAADVSSTAAPMNVASAADEATSPEASDARSPRALAGGEHAAWTISGSALLGRKVPMPHETVKVTIRRGYGDDGEVLVERELVTNDVGVFELPLDPPSCGVTVRAFGANPEFAVFSDRRWCPPGESAPTGLAVGFYPLDATIRGRVVELDGTPIDGARVVGFGAKEALTNRNGEFESRTSSLASPTMLEVSEDAHLFRRVSVDATRPGAVDGVEIRLERGARIFGRVLSEDGRPLAGATITTWYSWSTNTTSDAEGRFEFNNAPRNPGRYLVTASVDGAPVAVVERTDPEPPQEEIVLVAHSTRPIEGRLVDENGAPVAAAKITARLGWSNWLLVSSDDLGVFRFDALARVEHTLSVEKLGFARMSTTLAADANGPLELVLGHGRTLRGMVRGEDGRPIAGVSVTSRIDGLPNYEQAVRTGVDGAFELPNTPSGEHTEVEAYGDGWSSAQQKVVDDAAPIELVMRRSAGISGRVVDAETLRPITRFRIAFVMPVLEPGERGLPRHRADWVEPGLEFENDDGLWSTEFDALEPDRFVGIAVHAAGYGTRILTHVKTSTDPDATPLSIALGRARVLAGRVVDKATGRGLAGAHVSCFSQRAPVVTDTSSGLPRAVADEHGEFRLEDLPEEPVSLLVEADGFARAIESPLEVPVGESRHDVQLTAGATIRGRLFDARDRALARRTVRLGVGTHGVPFREWMVTTDADGAFEFEAIPRGEYFLSQELPDRRTTLSQLTRYVRIDDEEVRTVDLRPPGKLTLRGELRAKVPVPGNLAIRAWCATDRLAVACLSEGAQFELEGLAPGKWYVSAEWYDGGGEHDLVGQAELEVGERDPAPIVIELQPPLRRPPDQLIRNDAPAKQ